MKPVKNGIGTAILMVCVVAMLPVAWVVFVLLNRPWQLNINKIRGGL